VNPDGGLPTGAHMDGEVMPQDGGSHGRGGHASGREATWTGRLPLTTGSHVDGEVTPQDGRPRGRGGHASGGEIRGRGGHASRRGPGGRGRHPSGRAATWTGRPSLKAQVMPSRIGGGQGVPAGRLNV
jgi:hypothetical protein